MWSFKPRHEVSVSELTSKILEEKSSIEGVTLLGGEPLDQFEEVSQLLHECRKMQLTTMLFTGYEMDEIYHKGASSIIDLCDILITGRYDETKRTLNHQWIGSANQEIHFLTDAYKDFETINSNYVEISINDFGKTEIFGFPDENIVNELQNLSTLSVYEKI